MTLFGRLLIACGAVLAGQMMAIAIHQGTDPEPSPVPQLGPSTLPDKIGDFVGRDEPLDEDTVAATHCDAMLNRVYENRIGESISVNVGVWTDYRLGIPHTPDMCYPSAGWEPVVRKEVVIPTYDDQSVNAKEFIFQRQTSQIAVTYWVHLGDTTIANPSGIRPLRQRLRTTGENLPPLVKVMLHTSAPDAERAKATLNRFAAALFPHTAAIH